MILIGTSGFKYWGWKGIFYPPDLPTSRWLEHYSKYFNAVEINSTFYRLPVKSSFRNYIKHAPDIKYVLKLYRGITHFHSLKEENFSPFFEAIEILGDAFYGILAQFPSKFAFNEKNCSIVETIIKKFKGINLSFELRSPTWEGKLDIFKSFDISVCCADFPESFNWCRDCFNSSRLAYYRFHGRRKLYSDSYTEDELKVAAEKIKKATSKDKLIFFNNTSYGYAVNNALFLKKLLSN